MKIVVDAGHGKDTLGKRTVDGKMKEYEFNSVVANYVDDLLEEYQDVEVLFTHSATRDTPLEERTDEANEWGANVFISIHANAYGDTWNDVSGIETYIYKTKPKKAHELAIVVHNQLLRNTGRTNRGVKTANFHVLRETHMTALLLECGFMTNKEDARLLMNDEYRYTCAESIVKGLVEYYGLKKKEASSIFTVQVGAFEDKANAEKLVLQLDKTGIQNSFIREIRSGE